MKNMFMRRWLNTRGYGVQSPFAFNFLHDVIRQKIPYYAYGELRKSRRPDEINTVQEDEMLFRIANFAQTKSIIMPAEWKGSSRYLSAGCTTAKIEFYTNDNVAQTIERQDPLGIVCYNQPQNFLETEQLLLSKTGEQTICIIKNLLLAPEIWNIILQDDKVSVLFDIRNWGILFINTKLTHGRYYITDFK